MKISFPTKNDKKKIVTFYLTGNFISTVIILIITLQIYLIIFYGFTIEKYKLKKKKKEKGNKWGML